MNAIRNYIKALRVCAVQCFNANQVTQHQHAWIADAVKQEQKAWDELPRWVKTLLRKYA